MNEERRRSLTLLVLFAAIGAVAAVTMAGGLAAAQEGDVVANETVPGISANETGNVTTEVLWNETADAENDSATVTIEYVVDAENDTVNATDTLTVDAEPGVWTTNETELAPDEDVEEFRVEVVAPNGSVDDVRITDDISGTAIGAIGGEEGGAIGIVVLVVIAGVLYTRRDS